MIHILANNYWIITNANVVQKDVTNGCWKNLRKQRAYGFCTIKTGSQNVYDQEQKLLLL